MDLRLWKPNLFNSTDFKIDDTLLPDQHFNTFTLRKVDELVAYKLTPGIGQEKTHAAPSLRRSAGTHVEADEFHRMLEEKEEPTIVLDVRNVYESTVGHFQPPQGSNVEFCPIPMQNSSEFAPWLNAPSTKKMLMGKKVMMYCTGGIRCERASALLNEMTESDPTFQTKGVYELRGGIHRYMTSYPEGGHWVGKNYVFDKRREQVPARLKQQSTISSTGSGTHDNILSCCSSCSMKCDQYRGEYKCSKCRCPILVCNTCRHKIEQKQEDAPMLSDLNCDLCRVGYVAPVKRPKLKRKRITDDVKEDIKEDTKEDTKQIDVSNDHDEEHNMKKKQKMTTQKTCDQKSREHVACPRLYVAKLPFMVCFKDLQDCLCRALNVNPVAVKEEEKIVLYAEWKYDRNTTLFYGTAFVKMNNVKNAQLLIELCKKRGGGGGGVTCKGQRLRIAWASLKKDENTDWPNNQTQEERPRLPKT
jgi:predicted sulfurtransferase